MPIVAFGAISVVIAALMALLLIYGMQLLGKAIAQLVPNWHIPGLGNIRSAVESVISRVVGLIANALSHAVTPIEAWILAPWHALNELIGRVVLAAHDIYHAIVAVKHYAGAIVTSLTHFVAERVAALEHLAYYLYNAARAYAAAIVTSLTHFVAGRVAALEHLAYYLYAGALAYAAGIYATLFHFIAERVTALEHLSAYYYGQAVAEAHALYQQGLHYAKAVAESAAAAAVGVLTTDVIHAIHRDWVKITDEVKVLEGVIATDLPDIGAAVRAIDLSLPVDLAAVLAGVVAIDVPMLRYLEECGIPNCKNTGKFGRDLQDLFAVVEGVAMLGFIEEMIREPQRTANATIDVLQPVFTGTVNVFKDLVGAA